MEMSEQTSLNPLTAAVFGPKLEDWNEFENALQVAVNAHMPSGVMPYGQVNVRMICFEEDDLGCLDELTSFREFLEQKFGWSCETWIVQENIIKFGVSRASNRNTQANH